VSESYTGQFLKPLLASRAAPVRRSSRKAAVAA